MRVGIFLQHKSRDRARLEYSHDIRVADETVVHFGAVGATVLGRTFDLIFVEVGVSAYLDDDGELDLRQMERDIEWVRVAVRCRLLPGGQLFHVDEWPSTHDVERAATLAPGSAEEAPGDEGQARDLPGG